MNKKTRTLVSAASALAVAISVSMPASAAPAQNQRSTWMSGEVAQIGEIAGMDGNSHLIGFSGKTDGFSDFSVTNFDCPEGQLPSWDPESGCEIVGSLGMYGYDLTVNISKKLSRGTISGLVRVYEGDTESGDPLWGEARDVNITMKATGKMVVTKDKQDGYTRTDKERPAVTTSGQVGEFDVTGAEGSIVHVKESYKD